jgi:ornithine carbamoyltransferase
VPVINGLTNEYHPCQILADVFTYIDHRGPIRGKTVAWIGDSNNVCNTWLQAAALFDFKLHISTPPGYEVEKERMNRNSESFSDPMQAAKGADLVTTDVWTSMGFESENEARKRDFQDWMVDGEMMRAAKKDALFMHCLPAHRGEEVAAEVIDGPAERWCGTRPRTGCTRRRRCSSSWWWERNRCSASRTTGRS